MALYNNYGWITHHLARINRTQLKHIRLDKYISGNTYFEKDVSATLVSNHIELSMALSARDESLSEAVEGRVMKTMHAIRNDYALRQYGNPVVFIDDQDLVDMCLNMTTNLPYENFALPLNGACFTFSFHKDLKIDGKQIPGLLLTHLPKGDWVDFIKWINRTNLVIRAIPLQEQLEDGKTIQWLDRDSAHWYSVDATPFMWEGIVSNRESWLEEHAQTMFRLSTFLCCYLTHHPESIIRGFPENYSKDAFRLKPAETHTVKKTGFNSQSNGGTKSPHFRRGTFRYLQHERYKKKRFESIWISPTWVNSCADPHCVEDLSEAA